MYFNYIPLRLTPDRGICMAVCRRKNIKFFINQQIKIKTFSNGNNYLGLIFIEVIVCSIP